VPGWHEVTKQLQDAGKVHVVGIVEEQHPDRTRLFMQWKGMDWPVMVDSLDLLGVSGVPITLFLDEEGIIRAIQPKKEDLDRFLAEDAKGEISKVPRTSLPDLEAMQKLSEHGSQEHLKGYADALFLWGGPQRLDSAIGTYADLLTKNPDDGTVQFSLGVAYRLRYDSGSRDPVDFHKAVEHWTKALEIDPNQYIWRRRIQQYGPRLDKPYSFYDWVERARNEILARGETPLPLVVEPGGAELAYPSKSLIESGLNAAEPDPGSRIRKDQEDLVRVRSVVVPNTSDGELSARVHILFSPNLGNKAHWNNEAGDMKVWLATPEDIEIDTQLVVLEVPREEVSQETRRAEFELRSETRLKGNLRVPGYALYYVCEDVTGTCLYRRLDFEVEF
jgi:tetratricopeptide (TPR) repeat protein